MKENLSALDAKDAVKLAWQDQAVWSETANLLKKDLTLWRNLAGIAGIAGAFLETLAATLVGLEEWRWLRILSTICGAVLLAVVPYVMKTKASNDRVNQWVRARSASEALKETIYRYLVRSRPFTPDSTTSDLFDRCGEVMENVADMISLTAPIKPTSKDRPHALTIDEYIDKRVNNQIGKYYRPKAEVNYRAAKKLHDLEFALGLLAIAMGALASISVTTDLSKLSAVGPWIAVVTTAGAAVTAHLAASRYDHQAMIYTKTANRLARLRNKWLADPNRHDPTIIDRFVDECEHAISTENESWLTEWTGDKKMSEERRVE